MLVADYISPSSKLAIPKIYYIVGTYYDQEISWCILKWRSCLSKCSVGVGTLQLGKSVGYGKDLKIELNDVLLER